MCFSNINLTVFICRTFNYFCCPGSCARWYDSECLLLVTIRSLGAGGLDGPEGLDVEEEFDMKYIEEKGKAETSSL